jgi:site-specific recombinase XerC
LFLEHLAQQQHRGVDRLTLSDVTSQQVLDFLLGLETHRGNQAVTRNLRLAALRSWVKHLLRQDPAHADQYARILAVPAKRTLHAQPDYLEPEQFSSGLKPGRNANATRDSRRSASIVSL